MKSILSMSWQRPLNWLISSLATLMLALALVAIAEFLLADDLRSEILALIGVILAVPAFFIGCLAFLLLIYARLRTVLFPNDKEQG